MDDYLCAHTSMHLTTTELNSKHFKEGFVRSKLPSRNIPLIYISPSPTLGESDFCQSNEEYKLCCLGLHLFDLQSIQRFFYVK